MGNLSALSEISAASPQAEAGTKPGNSPAVPNVHLRPLQVFWEMTRALDWKISPARRARMLADKQELSTAEAFHLIQEIVAMRVPLLTLTGGDPLLRPDLFPIVEFAAKRSVRTSLVLLPTPLLDPGVIADLKACGLIRLSFWLHGSTPSLHDTHTGISGSHRRTLEIIGSCHESGLQVQVNTILSQRNFRDIDLMIDMLMRLDVILWNVCFLVPSGPDQAAELLTPEQHEVAFAKLYAASRQVQFQIKTTEGQHYQRYVLQRRSRESRGRISPSEGPNRPPKGVNDSRGFVFVNSYGQIYPSRYLPLSGGNIMTEPLSKVFRESALFVSLRDSSRLKGKCSRCHFRNLCGGSRARAYALTGDLFAEEPCCAYQP
jgi:radical SAM protein with 4Fe4S-binding SPASM domain